VTVPKAVREALGLNAAWDEVIPPDPGGRGHRASVSAFIDANVLIRHLSGDPPQLAARAAAYLRAESELFLADLVAAETAYVLESFYEAPAAKLPRPSGH
jgi:hypothetical protein